jgi:hypothetical protein
MLGGDEPSGDTGDVRNKAAEAAQVCRSGLISKSSLGRIDHHTDVGNSIQKRAEALNASNKGKLGSQLAAQKAQTHAQTLNEASQAEREARNADNAEQVRRWD